MQRLTALALALLISGCAFPRALEHIAVDQNEVVAQSANRVTLLNILRAKDDRPLHFTAISRLSGNVSAELNAGANLSAQLSGAPNTSTNPFVGGNVSTNPSFDITVFDSQEFQNGILQPIAPSILNFYLRTGWRPDLITVMVVQRIDFRATRPTTIPSAVGGGDIVVQSGESLAALINQPTQADAAARFKAFVECYRLGPVQRQGEDLPLQRFKDMPNPSLADLTKLDGKTFDLGKGPNAGASNQSADNWVVRKSAGGETVKLVREHSTDIAASDMRCGAIEVSLADGGGTVATVSITPDATKAVLHIMRGGKAENIDATVDVTFRSVDGTIYFLGEYARATVGKDPMIYPIATNDGYEPLLVIRRGKGGRYDLNAALNGSDYHVPATGAGRSYEVITLVEQLFNLNKKGASVPLSTPVRLVN